MSTLAALTALTLSCATCPAGQFAKGCDALGNKGTCTACRTCPSNSILQNPCSGPFDTACKNEPCNATTSCQGLFCNYPADTVSTCRLTWNGADAALGTTFLCTRPATQGKCAPSPPDPCIHTLTSALQVLPLPHRLDGQRLLVLLALPQRRLVRPLWTPRLPRTMSH